MSERSIFLNAIDKADPAERAAYLDEACAGDPGLRQRVEELLGSHEQAGSFLGVPAVDYSTPTGITDTLPRAGGEADEVLSLLDSPEKPGVLGMLKHYEVVDVIGRGGMGVVLKAFDPTLSRFVAIKLMAPQLAAAPSARRRFEREARAAAAVSHEHVVAIYEVNEFKGVPYLVMEFVKGVSLQQRLDEQGPQAVKEVLRIGHQTALGLAAAHAQGLVHRDIKPDNILLHNGVERVKITDFGLARAIDDTTLTQPGVITGTPAYMSPEQARGESVDHRSDLFSLGSVLYALCSGAPPFHGDSLPVVLKQIDQDEPPSLRDRNPDAPDWLAAIIAKLHARDPLDRFQSAKEIADLLGQHLAHLQQPGEVPMPAPVLVPRRAARRSRTPSWLILLVVALVGCVMVIPVGLIALMFLWGFTRTDLKPNAPQPIQEAGELVTRPALDDQDRIQGTWRAIAGERAGKEMKAAELGIVRMTFTGSRLDAEFGHGKATGTFTLNPTAEPKQITVRSRTDNNMAMEGVYRFVGDTLILCMGSFNEDRPTKFASDPARPTLVMATFEREE